MQRIDTALPGVIIIEPRVFQDARGFFFESYHVEKFAALGLNEVFVQDNHSRSLKGVLRGLHYQDLRVPMGKLVRCTVGAIYDVAVDLRVGSPTFGKWVGVELSAENFRQLWVPVGFGHGFCVVSEVAEVQYKCTGLYAPETEGVVQWDDPEIGIEWPVTAPIISARDAGGQSLAAYFQSPAFTVG